MKFSLYYGTLAWIKITNEYFIMMHAVCWAQLQAFDL